MQQQFSNRSALIHSKIDIRNLLLKQPWRPTSWQVVYYPKPCVLQIIGKLNLYTPLLATWPLAPHPSRRCRLPTSSTSFRRRFTMHESCLSFTAQNRSGTGRHISRLPGALDHVIQSWSWRVHCFLEFLKSQRSASFPKFFFPPWCMVSYPIEKEMSFRLSWMFQKLFRKHLFAWCS